MTTVMTNEELQEHLDRVECKLDEVLNLLHPVSAHAQWVDSLRGALDHMRLIKDTRRIKNQV